MVWGIPDPGNELSGQPVQSLSLSLLSTLTGREGDLQPELIIFPSQIGRTRPLLDLDPRTLHHARVARPPKSGQVIISSSTRAGSILVEHTTGELSTATFSPSGFHSALH
ncbi:UNVERIFIED_CONTAM: hypothetical protein FKN15_030087 [Acipenser sinensis]